MSGERLPTGVYANPDGDETITITDDQIAFHIELIGKKAGQTFDRSYKYRVMESGQIQPYPVREADGVYGIGNFTFHWNEGAILQRASSSKQDLQTFSRSD